MMAVASCAIAPEVMSLYALKPRIIASIPQTKLIVRALDLSISSIIPIANLLVQEFANNIFEAILANSLFSHKIIERLQVEQLSSYTV
jgi:hypothetical protein